MEAKRRLRVVIIGAGPGGLCMAIQLQKSGYDDFVILEKGEGVGGTWYHNRYPGCACDVESHLYSYSFEVKTDWSRPYGSHAEIRSYFECIERKYALTPHIRFGRAVRSAQWDEASSVWRVEAETGEVFEAEIVVSAMGMFNELHWPKIEGLDRFGGKTFHSARWDHEHDLTGEAVGVIGSAASAVQFVPEIAKQAGQLSLYQRTANWVAPKPNDPYTPEQLEHFRTDRAVVAGLRSEIYQNVDNLITFSNEKIMRAVEARAQENLALVEDAELRRKLTPDHPYGCKRPLISSDYYQTFNRPNVEVVTEAIESIDEDSIRSADGVARKVDTIILATGFDTTKYLSAIDVWGRGGQSIDEAWRDGARAYLGITTAGFPNLFMLYGPNTNNGSIIYMIEQQVGYALRQIERIVEEQLAWVDVRPEVQDRYNDAIQLDIENVDVWQANCNGYYRSSSGRVVTQWPHTMTEFQKRTSERDVEAFEVGRLA